jgi:hypothetical protein
MKRGFVEELEAYAKRSLSEKEIAVAGGLILSRQLSSKRKKSLRRAMNRARQDELLLKAKGK